ncbi:sensor histidine kinase [Streptomyces sp. WI04-05B]|uniref:sensor histidine kinase n=1 Tax=Streptomyces TaxID=1883 RepID=UPI0029A4D6A3|nr:MULTISPECIES: histidine kinase [unclassified Streptomyces]MDX2548076.1 histidine kinase [Streptomyces sp. WI04-05B]MDX2583044.1 histidine kinase [Streptomyces sp. WI04-05A]
MTSDSPRNCARAFAVALLVMAGAVDVLDATDSGYVVWPHVLVLALGYAALLWPSSRRPQWSTPQLRTGVPAVVSLLFTAGSLLLDQQAPFGPGETLVLLILLFMAVRQCPQPWAVVCATLNAAALLGTPARFYRDDRTSLLGFMLVELVLIGFVAGLAGYLRALDHRRAAAVVATRRAERVAIAADLHDFVAHHVTGILVQTQMARMMATTRPESLDTVLAGIERAATEALASMRRTVGVLRDTGPDAADRRPVGDLDGIAELAEGFASPVQHITLDRDPAVPDNLPHEVQAAAFRVVQEALTNVRRHAGDATEITVRLRHDGRRLEVGVTDDGRGGTQLPAAAHGGGFGLVGLTERVTALGGDLRAGPPSGRTQGWEVRALFPTGKT